MTQSTAVTAPELRARGLSTVSAEVGWVMLTEGHGAPVHRHRRWRRLAPLVVLAVAAFAAGIVVGSRSGGAERRVATAYVQAWARGDYRHMYALLDPRSRRHLTRAQFTAAFLGA